MKYLISAAGYLIGNAIGLLLAALLVDGFSIEPLAFIVAVLVFSVIMLLAEPILRKLTQNRAPALMGGIALVATFVGLLVTGLLVSGLNISGLSAWLMASLIVWIGAVVAGLLVPRYVFGQRADTAKK